MAKSFQLQSSFSSGVLDPTMRARFDTSQFYNGVETGDNVKFLPQGGARRRGGLEYIGTLTDGSGNPTAQRLIPFVISSDEYYVLAFSKDQILVYDENDALIDTVTTNVSYATAEIFEIDYAQSDNTMLLVHEDHAPKILSYSGSTFTLTTVTFVEIPQYDFDDGSSPTPTSEVQQIVFTSIGANATYKLTLEGIDTYELTYQDNASGAGDIQAALIDLLNTPDTGIAVVRSAANTFDVTFSGAAAKDWRLIVGRRTDAGTGTIAATETTTGVPSTEDTWSSTRGWPRTCTFHEGRLWFGGSKSRPNTVWGSYVNSFFNFGFGRSRDYQGIEYTLNTDQQNKINAIYSSRTLQVFTSGGEFTVVQNEFDPITPSNIRIASQTRYGAKQVTPVDIEGVVTFVQRTGKAIREMFSESQGLAQTYTAPSISFLAPALVDDPVQLGTVRGTSAEDANYILVINSGGTCSVFNTLREQSVAAWSRWTTDGSFRSVAVCNDTMYFITEREVNSATVFFLEKINESVYTDATKLYTSLGSATVTGLSHLEGEEVRVKRDGAVDGNKTVSSGQITMDASGNSVEVGLEYTVTLKTMPISQDAGAGFNLDNEVRITRCVVDLYQSLGIIINGESLPDRQMGDAMDTPPAAYTGRKQMPLLGWSKSNQVTITQSDPVPMTLLGLGLEVDG